MKPCLDKKTLMLEMVTHTQLYSPAAQPSRLRQVDVCEFLSNLAYIASFRPARAIESKSLSQKIINQSNVLRAGWAEP